LLPRKKRSTKKKVLAYGAGGSGIRGGQRPDEAVGKPVWGGFSKSPTMSGKTSE